MRRLVVAIVVALAGASRLGAQLPPNIAKPIDAARKAAAKTDAQTKSQDAIRADEAKPQPAAAAQAPKGVAAKGAATLPQKADAQAPKPGDGKKFELSAAAKAAMQFSREEYSWNEEGRRDPFLSLLATSEIRPLLADLVLIGVIYDLSGRNSVASLLDATSSEMYRVKVGNIIGRMKVAKIGAESITLQIDEFGFSRQETLLLDRNRKAGNAPGRRP